MSALNIELCPETGICSILKQEDKVDLVPDEVESMRAAGNDMEQVRAVIAESSATFAKNLPAGELRQIQLAVAKPKKACGCSCCER